MDDGLIRCFIYCCWVSDVFCFLLFVCWRLFGGCYSFYCFCVFMGMICWFVGCEVFGDLDDFVVEYF